MSRKTSPVSGPSRRPRRSPGARPTQQRRRKERVTPGAQEQLPQDHHTTREKMRSYIKVALLPNAIVLAFVIAAAFGGLLLTSTTLSALPATIAHLWLTLNAAPVSGRGVDISLMPLLPAFLVGYGTYRRVRTSPAVRGGLKDMGLQAIWIVGIPVLLTLTAIVMLVDAATVFDVGVPNVAIALLRTAGIYIVAFLFGLRQPLWEATSARWGLEEALYQQVGRAVRLCVWFMVAGGGVTLVSLGIHHQQIAELSSNYSPLGNLGVWLLSLLYLPNAALSGWALLMGSEFAMGVGSVSLYGSTLPPLPPVPLMAALPLSVSPYALALLVIPAVIMTIVVIRKVPTAVESLYLTVATMVVATCAFFYAGGTAGIYEYVGPTILLSIGLAVAWVAVASFMTTGVATVVSRLGAARNDQEEQPFANDEDTVDDTEEEISDREFVEEDQQEHGGSFAEQEQHEEEDFLADEFQPVGDSQLAEEDPIAEGDANAGEPDEPALGGDSAEGQDYLDAEADIEDYLLDAGWDAQLDDEEESDHMIAEGNPRGYDPNTTGVPGDTNVDIPVIGEPAAADPLGQPEPPDSSRTERS